MQVCHANPAERSRFIRCVYNLLKSNSAAVKYEAAGTLVTLSSYPAAIKEAASAYIELIVKESDNNVKLIVLDRLMDLRQSTTHEKILQELVMDILRVGQLWVTCKLVFEGFVLSRTWSSSENPLACFGSCF